MLGAERRLFDQAQAILSIAPEHCTWDALRTAHHLTSADWLRQYLAVLPTFLLRYRDANGQPLRMCQLRWHEMLLVAAVFSVVYVTLPTFVVCAMYASVYPVVSLFLWAFTGASDIRIQWGLACLYLSALGAIALFYPSCRRFLQSSLVLHGYFLAFEPAWVARIRTFHAVTVAQAQIVADLASLPVDVARRITSHLPPVASYLDVDASNPLVAADLAVADASSNMNTIIGSVDYSGKME
jgi:hypothetical protein